MYENDCKHTFIKGNTLPIKYNGHLPQSSEYNENDLISINREQSFVLHPKSINFLIRGRTISEKEMYSG